MALQRLSGIVGELYRLYPRHVGPRAAERAIKKALTRIALELKVEGIETAEPEMWLKSRVIAFAQSPAGGRGMFTPHPSTWFNGSRYLDDESEWSLMTPEEEENLRRYRAANIGAWRPQ